MSMIDGFEFPPLISVEIMPLHPHEGFLYICRMGSPTDQGHADWRCPLCVRAMEARCKQPWPPGQLIGFGDDVQQIVPLAYLVQRSLALLGMAPA